MLKVSLKMCWLPVAYQFRSRPHFPMAITSCTGAWGPDRVAPGSRVQLSWPPDRIDVQAQVSQDHRIDRLSKHLKCRSKTGN